MTKTTNEQLMEALKATFQIINDEDVTNSIADFASVLYFKLIDRGIPAEHASQIVSNSMPQK